MHSKSKKLWLDLKIAILCRRFLLDILCYLTSGRTQPAGRNFCWGITPAHLAATAQVRARIDLARVVERHASACLRTMGVVSLCGVVVTRRRRYVGARIVPSPRITMETVV